MARRRMNDNPLPGNDVVLRKEPCPKCGSKDNLVRYADMHAHCFTPGCGHWEKAGEGMGAMTEVTRPAAPKEFLKPDERAYEALTTRRLEAKTLQRFGYFQAGFKGKRVQVAQVYDQKGDVAIQKLRLPDKTFPCIKREGAPKLTECWLYGRHVWGDKHDRKVVVFTGEHDAHTAAQVTDFKFPCVSGLAGDEGMLAHLKANYQWLMRFEEIILFFDNDKSAQGVLQECAQLFPAGRVKIAKMEEFKDASDALQAGAPSAIQAAIWSAYTWRPQGIVNASEGRDLFANAAGLMVPAWPYPWPNLQERTLGMRRGEVSYHVGGTGAAKTTILYHLADALMSYEGAEGGEGPTKIGWLGFEDTVRSVKTGIMSIHAGRRLHMDPVAQREVLTIHDEVFGSGKMELYDPEHAEWGLEAILGYVHYMAKALDCAVIFVDPLSFIVAGMDLADNERRALDKASAEFAAMAKSLNIHIHISHHLNRPDGTPHERGAEITLNNIKGSGGLAHFSSNVFGYERDQQGERADLVRVRALKIRFTGLTAGRHQVLIYDPKTGRYTHTEEEMPAGGGDTKDMKPSFGAQPEGDY